MASIPGLSFADAPLPVKRKTKVKPKSTPHNKTEEECERNDLQKAILEKDRKLQHMSDVVEGMRTKYEKLKQSYVDYERKFKTELMEERERGRKQSEASLIVQQDAMRQIESLTASNERIQTDLETTQMRYATAKKELEEFKQTQSLNERQIERCTMIIQQQHSDFERTIARISQLETANDEIQKVKHSQMMQITHLKKQEEEKIDHMRKQEFDIEKLKSDLKETQRACGELSKQLSDAVLQTNIMKKEQKKQISELTTQRNELIAKHTELMTKVGDKEEKNNQIEEQLHQTKNELLKEQATIQTYKAHLSKASKDTEKLTASLAEEKTKTTYTQTQLNKVEEKLRQTKYELQQERQTIESLKEKLRKKKEVTLQNQTKANPQVSENNDLIKDLQHLVDIKERMFQHDKRILEKQLKKLKEENKTLVEANEHHSQSLALTMDDRALEKICIQNRPIKIAENYTILMAKFWNDANSSLEEVTTDEVDKIMLLFDILMICEEEATKLYKLIIQDLQITLENPFNRYEACGASGCEPPIEGSDTEIEPPHHVLTVIEDYLRTNAHRVDLKELRQRVEATLQTKYGKHKLHFISISLRLDDVSRFVTESVRITWKMALQRQPMIFDASQIGQPWHNDGHLELIAGSEPDAENAVIQYYQGPTLLHAGNVMVNGSVFVHPNKNP